MKTWVALVGRAVLIVCFVPTVAALAQDEPLHALIDKHLAPVAGLEPVRCSDAEFLRRVSLDLIGMPPTSDEARAFLADEVPDKRQRLIDRLFASPHHTRHMAAVLDVMLMERRAYVNVSADEWHSWLLRSVRENKPWNVLAREILAADGDKSEQRAPARFALDRGSDPHAVTRDVGRVFFGRDMQCAQCHDHPLVEDYLQSDYHGLLAFIVPSYALVQMESGATKTLQAEKAGSDLTFESVFEGIPRRTAPRMPDSVAIDEPFFLPGDEYQVLPADNVKSVPKFSRRAKLAELATNGSNEVFNENIVNRLWAHMFGRGLVHPLDLHHPTNPPTDPKLLQLLAQRFVAMNFDMRAFLRELALTSAYQRSMDMPDRFVAAAENSAEEVAQLEKQRADAEEASQASAKIYEKSLDAWKEVESAYLPVAAELDAARAKYAEAKKNMDDAVKALAEAKSQLQVKKLGITPLERAAIATEEALKVLPGDTQLAEASQKLAARSQELTAEVATLSKALEEKTAAIGPPTAAFGSVMPLVGEALSKATPLQLTLHQAEQEMLAARSRASLDAQILSALDRRLETMRRFAAMPPLHKTLVAAQQVATTREAELLAAQKHLDDFAPIVAEHEAAVQKATDELAASSTLASASGPGPLHWELASTTALVSAAATQPMVVEAVEKSAGEALAAAHRNLAAVMAERDARTKGVNDARAELATATADVVARQSEFDALVHELIDCWTDDFTLASIKPLSPEQLCWSIFRVTGVYDRNWKVQAAELDKTNPLNEEQQKDPAQLIARDVQIEQQTYDKLKGNVTTFVSLYGAGAGQPQSDFFATADQALFAANANAINEWVKPAGDNVTARIVKEAEPRAAAEELYLSVLTRLPSEEEIGAVVSYLANRAADKDAAARELVWALLNSAEFRFNH